MITWVLVALFTPLLGAIINGFFGHPFKRYAHLVAVPATGISWLSSLWLLKFVLEGGPLAFELYTWIPVDPFRVSFGLLLDPLSAVMAATVTTVSFFVHLYSIEYMRGDPAYRRFFANLNLFVFSMLLLVLSNNFLLLFVGWEAVGLCSYLLISHWYEKKSARDAGKKAFIVNRIGDAGFILGIFTLFALFGSVNYIEIFPNVGNVSAPLVTTAALLLFMGAIGKSAQFPLCFPSMCGFQMRWKAPLPFQHLYTLPRWSRLVSIWWQDQVPFFLLVQRGSLRQLGHLHPFLQP